MITRRVRDRWWGDIAPPAPSVPALGDKSARSWESINERRGLVATICSLIRGGSRWEELSGFAAGVEAVPTRGVAGRATGQYQTGRQRAKAKKNTFKRRHDDVLHLGSSHLERSQEMHGSAMDTRRPLPIPQGVAAAAEVAECPCGLPPELQPARAQRECRKVALHPTRHAGRMGGSPLRGLAPDPCLAAPRPRPSRAI